MLPSDRRWLVSYDNEPEIRRLWGDVRSIAYRLQYSAARVALGDELMAFSDSLVVPDGSSVRALDAALKRVADPRVRVCAR